MKMGVNKNKILLVILYTVLGFLLQFLRFTILKDLKHFGLAVSQIGLVQIIPFLPWSGKPFLGYFSDNFPIFGHRRKPYVVVCNILAAICTATLTIRYLTLDSYIAYLFFGQLFSCFADVCYDIALVAITREESPDRKGSFQTTMWLGRTIGGAIAAGLGPIIWEAFSDKMVFTIEACLFLLQAFIGYFVNEEYVTKKDIMSAKVFDTRYLDVDKPKQSYFGLVKKTFSDSIFYKLMVFNVLTGLLPSAGLSMFYFLTDELHYSPKTMALLDFIGQLSQVVGILCYKFGFKTFQIRRLYLQITVVSTLISIVPILITIPGKHCLVEEDDYNATNTRAILHGNQTFTSDNCYLFRELGISSLPFAFSDDVFGEILDQLRSMPLLNLTSILCQQGVEGVAYSLAIGLQNWVGMLQKPINSGITHLMQVDHNNFTNLPFLLVLCSSLELLSVCFVMFLPNATISEISVRYEHELASKHLTKLTEDAFTIRKTENEEDSPILEIM